MKQTKQLSKLQRQYEEVCLKLEQLNDRASQLEDAIRYEKSGGGESKMKTNQTTKRCSECGGISLHKIGCKVGHAKALPRIAELLKSTDRGV